MLKYLFYLVIIAASSFSYFIAIQNVLRGNYRPNVFSRAVWLILSINTLAGVLIGQSTSSSILLSIILALGSLGMLVASIGRGRNLFGNLEFLCICLLAISGIIWLLYDKPEINIGISLLAHFVGALPTFRQVHTKPRSESKRFWGLFFIASFVSLSLGWDQPISKQLVPLYFTLFDGTMLLLSLRGAKLNVTYE